jgi:DNA gyrase/topoisomerase IV subunit A
MSKIELETESAELQAPIKELTTLLASEAAIKSQISKELTEVSKSFATPRRTKVVK